LLQYLKIDVVDPQKELVDPAQLGTRNVLQEVNRTHSVERVVLTSSCAAIYGDNADLKKTRMEFSQKIFGIRAHHLNINHTRIRRRLRKKKHGRSTKSKLVGSWLRLTPL
jgi:nucleoside-diphosphate-sugar epimerase